MILPVRYLWEQLNGPQVTGICKAIEEYWKTIFDDKLDYFNNISVETANDSHLTLLGLLSGLIRPVISEADPEFFYFTEYAEQDVPYGFSSLEDPTVGGKFAKLDPGSTLHNVSLDTEYYRALLRAWTQGEGEIGSLMLLDDICAELSKLDLGSEVEPFYQFFFMSGPNIPVDRAPGDVFIDMRSMQAWHNALHVYAVLNGIANSVYAPQPRIFVSLSPSGRVTTPVITPASGTYHEPITVTMNVSHPADAVIHYTTDGSNPTADSPVYTEPITVSETCVIQAIGVADDYGDSLVARSLYTIE